VCILSHDAGIRNTGLSGVVPNPHASAAEAASNAHAAPSRAEQFPVPSALGSRPVKLSGTRPKSQTTPMVMREVGQVGLGPVPGGQERDRLVVRLESLVEAL